MKIIAVILFFMAFIDMAVLIPNLILTMQMIKDKEWSISKLIKCKSFVRLIYNIVGDSLLIIFFWMWRG
jgi:hypothetical protein